MNLIFRNQLPDRQTTQVHEGFGLGQQQLFFTNLHSRRQSPAPSVPDFNPTLAGNAIHGQKAQIMRRELVLDARIAETDYQFHATILKPYREEPRSARRTAESGCPHMSTISSPSSQPSFPPFQAS